MTRKISIDGIIFHVEPVGYEILLAYMDAWLQGNAQRKALWEEQAAEYLLQKLRNGKTVTTTEDVNGLTEILKEVPFIAEPTLPGRNGKTHKFRSGFGRYLTQIATGLW